MPRNNYRLLLAGLLPALLAILAGGCSRAARHDVLTFFFTGVPPLDGGGGKGAGAPRAPTVVWVLVKRALKEKRRAERDRAAALGP
ncbi:MAG: hypothetical protein WC001_12350, partial [Desulfurivibrionaceae bacterium]